MENSSSYDELLTLQRKEKKDLLAKTQKMKHAITKGDKKKKRDITTEIAQLLSDLELKHEEQLKQYKDQETENKESSCNDLIAQSLETNSVENNIIRNITEVEENLNDNNEIQVSDTSVKISKAQKRRNKKAQQQKEREEAIVKQEEENLFGLRHIESTKINKILSDRGLKLYEIPSDGNCLYQAIEHQLSNLNIQERTVSSLRDETAKYLRIHKDDFLPFIVHPKTGEMLTDEQFEKYCDDVANTPAWGGHVEIQVLSNVCGKPIEVIQADGPSVIVGEENAKPSLIICYHRHVYELGEHYNSVISAEKSSNSTTDVE